MRPGTSTKLTWTEKRALAEKECIECGQVLPIGKFEWEICGWRARCTTCHKKMASDRRKEQRQWVEDIKAHRGCLLCGESRAFALDFHHKDPKKKIATVSSLACKMSKKKAEVEIGKCVVLCRNCHAGVHAKALSLP